MNNLKISQVDYFQEIAAIKAIRTQVFQQEQKVPSSLEFDGLDEEAIHLLAYMEQNPVGTARIRKIDSQTAKIERLAVIKKFRNKNIGKKLMNAALEIARSNNYETVIVHAQEYIKQLYLQLGFQQQGATFNEAGISHVKMSKKIEEV